MNILKDKRFYRFLIPSLVGAFLFVTPLNYNGNLTIPIAVAANWLLDLMGKHSITIIWALISLSAVITILHRTVGIRAVKNIKIINIKDTLIDKFNFYKIVI